MNNSVFFKYKFVVVGYGYDYYNYVYRQLVDSPNAIYINNWPKTRITRRVFGDCFLHKVPLRHLWVTLYINFLRRIVKKKGFNFNEKICFVFLAGGANNELLQFGLCDKVRKSFENCKIVYFINDLVGKTKQPVSLMKEDADLVYSYDPLDCEKYGLINHVIPYSNYIFPIKGVPKYDVVFVGAAKDRLGEILSIYYYLSNHEVKCHFRIIGVPKEQQVIEEGISYSGRISYEENLRILLDSNCILDVIQGESSGNTIRVGEAIVMGKKLLTNNIHTRYNGVFDGNNMRVFTNVEEIDLPFLLDRSPIIYDIKEKMYPIELLREIDNKFANE